MIQFSLFDLKYIIIILYFMDSIKKRIISKKMTLNIKIYMHKRFNFIIFIQKVIKKYGR